MKQLKNLDEQLVRQLSEQRDEKHRFGYYYAVGRSESVLQKFKEQAFGLAPFLFVCKERMKRRHALPHLHRLPRYA